MNVPGLVRIAAALLLAVFGSLSARADDDAGREFFERKIRPVLVRHCYECHSSALAEPKGGLLLDSRAGVRQGGDTGPAVVLGNAEQSLLLEAVRHESFEMPPDRKLSQSVIDDLLAWVEMGAPDPREAPSSPEASARQLWKVQYAQRRQWWSLQPLTEPAIPDVHRADWSDQLIDRFVLANLEQLGLQPASRADRATRIRRLAFVLTGLPPAPADVDDFVRDDSPEAWRNLVDRLLDSPHFGEHWARHWMDVVRYTDTYGYEWDIPAKGAWRYRDYLIRAFNLDVPFNQLVREQIAGDLLESPRHNSVDQVNESLIGTMFFQMGEKRHGDSSEFNGIHQEMLDNKVDAFSKAFQALTISCARCHDHKLDAVAQREYYALAGIFMSSRWVANTVDLPQRNAEPLHELQQLKAGLRPLLASLWLEDVQRFDQELLAALQATPDDADGARDRVVEPNPAPIDRWRKLIEARRKQLPPLEDPLHAWSKLEGAAAAQGTTIRNVWNELASQYAGESQKRAGENATHFKLAVDFRQGIPDGWSVAGVGLREIVSCGDFTVALEGDAAVGRLLGGGLFTGSLSPRLNGAVRTPLLKQFHSGHISFEACGGDFAAHRAVIDNAFLTEKQQYLNQDEPGWILMPTRNAMKDRRIYIEFATKTSNPNFPPRVGLGGDCSEQQAADPRSWFGLSRVVLHEAGHTPVDELTRFGRLFANVRREGAEGQDGEAASGEPPELPADLPQAARRYADWFESAIRAWADNRATRDDVQLINWLLGQNLLMNDHRSREELAELVGRYREVEQRIAVPWTVNGMADIDEGFDYRLNVRGDYDQLGDKIPRGFVRCISEQVNAVRPVGPGSGRRELAELISSPDNPLTARVFANRIWHHLFGRGIVATPNNFGHLGERPSHPELLDHLAGRFVADGWSIKRLIRAIVLTETWQQSGAATAAARGLDPDNRLLHHYPLRRLEAEAIRDAMLAVSGRLDQSLFGPPINPYRVKEDAQKRLFSGPLDGNGRRSIYTKITIMEPPRFLALFNQPKPKITTGRRDLTNTPSQSLALLNDPLVGGQAEYWAERLVQRDESPAERLTRMFETAYGREPDDDEIQRWRGAIADLAAVRQIDQQGIMQSIPVWKDVAHAMFNTKEFIYFR